jgi:hypothetical protein
VSVPRWHSHTCANLSPPPAQTSAEPLVCALPKHPVRLMLSTAGTGACGVHAGLTQPCRAPSRRRRTPALSVAGAASSDGPVEEVASAFTPCPAKRSPLVTDPLLLVSFPACQSGGDALQGTPSWTLASHLTSCLSRWTRVVRRFRALLLDPLALLARTLSH